MLLVVTFLDISGPHGGRILVDFWFAAVCCRSFRRPAPHYLTRLCDFVDRFGNSSWGNRAACLPFPIHMVVASAFSVFVRLAVLGVALSDGHLYRPHARKLWLTVYRAHAGWRISHRLGKDTASSAMVSTSHVCPDGQPCEQILVHLRKYGTNSAAGGAYLTDSTKLIACPLRNWSSLAWRACLHRTTA